MFRFSERTGKFGGNTFYLGPDPRQARWCVPGAVLPVTPPPAKEPEHDYQIYRLFDYIDRRAFCLFASDFCALNSDPRCLPENLPGPLRGSVFLAVGNLVRSTKYGTVTRMPYQSGICDVDMGVMAIFGSARLQ
jgi:hypothetical protein